MIFRVLGESKVFLRAIVSERALAGKLLIPPVTGRWAAVLSPEGISLSMKRRIPPISEIL